MDEIKSKCIIALPRFSNYVFADNDELYRLPVKTKSGDRYLGLRKIELQNEKYYWLRNGETHKMEKWSKAQLSPHLETIPLWKVKTLIIKNNPF